MKKIVFAALSLLAGLAAQAQNEQDALRYSFQQPLYSARAQGMGGAAGALGSDMSGISINPAGLAMYRKSEVQATGGLLLQKASSNYLGSMQTSNSSFFKLPSIGAAFTDIYKTNGKEVNKGLVGMSFYLGFNNLGHYGGITGLNGINRNSSIIERFEADAQGIPYDQLDINTLSGLAWQTYLIDTVPGTTDRYYSPVSADTMYNMRQATEIQEKGSMTEFTAAGGLNLSNRLYLGLGLRVPIANFSQTNIYEERDPDNSVDGLSNMSYVQDLRTSGYGVGLNIGLIYKPADLFRIGVSYHTPVNLRMDDTYSSTMSATFDNNVTLPASTDPGIYSYKIHIPGRIVLSGLMMFEEYGLLSVDYERANYSNARLSAVDYAFTDANNLIASIYQPGNVLRVGTEWRIRKIYYIRGGYSWMSSPYTGSYNAGPKDNVRQCYTVGTGINMGNYSLDLAYLQNRYNSYYSPYVPESGPQNYSNIQHRADGIMLGFRYRF